MIASESRIKDFFPDSKPTTISQPMFIVNQIVINYPELRNPFSIIEETEPDIDPRFFQEERAFFEMKNELYQKYPEKYVAICNGKVIDVDEDNSKLAERVYKKHFKVPIYIDKVTYDIEVGYLSSPTTGKEV